MIIVVESYDGTDLQDSNLSAYFPPGSFPFTMETTSVVSVPRHKAPPAAVDVVRSGFYFALYIKLLGTTHTQLQTLKSLFDPTDARTNSTTGTIMKRLILSDSADSNKNWYIDCRAVSYRDLQAKALFVVDLYSEGSTLYENTQSTDSWSITASGQTHDVTTAGTLRTPPIFEITPTAAKSGGLIYRRFVKVYNPLTLAYANEGLEITFGGLDTTALVNDTTVSNQINDGDGITDSDTTIDIDTAVGGGLPTSGMGYVGTEQISWTANSGTQLTGVTRGIGGTSAASHANNAVIARSKALANGNDVQVIVDGVQAPRWFGTGSNAFNQAATYIYITDDWKAKIEGTIAAITDSATTLTFQDTTANKTTLKNLPAAGIGLLESEIITWTAKDESKRQLTGLTRAAKFTSAAAHAAGVTFRWIEHDIILAYGDPGAATPTIDDTHKPMFALTSTNTSRVYSTSVGFATAGQQRANEWKPAVLASLAPIAYRESRWYETDYSTAGAAEYADPATEMGMRIASWLYGTTVKSESAQIEWRYYDPAAVTTVTATGEKYRTATSWPTATFQKSALGTTFSTVWTEATPASASTWAAWAAHSGVSLGAGTWKWLRFLFSGAVVAGSGYEADTECDAITLTRTSASVLQGALGSENSSYDLNCTITNNDTGEYMTVRYQMDINQTLRINCETQQVIYLKDNTGARSAVTGWSSTRQQWLDLLGNTANTLQFDDAGAVANTITFVTKWRDRTN